jgi:hypothetical protein
MSEINKICQACEHELFDEDDSKNKCHTCRVIETAPELLEACIKALQFIRNGIELGYIQLPKKPDTALLTQAIIEKAIAKATKQQDER